MILVFCELTDTAALWAAERLRGGGAETEVVTAPALGSATRWEHRVGRSGASVEIELDDGRRLSSRRRMGVLNRLSFVPTERLDRIAGADRDYAVQEMNALFLSWLHALPGPVVNRPAPQGLGGNWRHPSMWAALAGRAGLPVATYRQSSETDPNAAWLAARPPFPTTVFVVGEAVVASPIVGGELRQACARLARAAGESLLGIDLGMRHDGTWEVGWISPLPDLMRGGERIVEALAAVLEA